MKGLRRHGTWMFAAVCGLAVATGYQASAAGGVEQGRDIYEKRCTGCHKLDGVKAGPPLRGVYGRRAGSDAKFPYSDALKKSTLVWDDANLDKWLSDPDSLVPDNDMSFRLDDAAERSALIAYLKQLSADRKGQP